MAERFLIPDILALPEGVPMPENMKKRKEKLDELRKERDEAVAARRAKNAEIRKALHDRTLVYEEGYKAEQEGLLTLKKDALSNGGFYREPEAKVIFAIRLHGVNKLAPKPKKILQLFRLRQLNNGVFIKVNKATMEMIKVIQPFITYGYPSLSTIRKLIYKRGYMKIGKGHAYSRLRIQSNDMISTNLGNYGIHGVEDLVHEIVTCGPNFKQATNFLWPFKLDSPKGGFVAKRRGFCDPRGGDWGNREIYINKLVKAML